MRTRLTYQVFTLLCVVVLCGRTATAQVLWEPPASLYVQHSDTLEYPQTLRHPLISKFRLSGFPVVLEETRLPHIQARFGGTIGQSGDASESLSWLCFHGADRDGAWALWVDEGEVGAGFELRRVSTSAAFDARCQLFSGPRPAIRLPHNLRLGDTRQRLRRLLGRPSAVQGDTWVYSHRRTEVFRGDTFESFNDVSIGFDGSVVIGIDVSQTTTN